jgi:hypothetical protein
MEGVDSTRVSLLAFTFDSEKPSGQFLGLIVMSQ